MTPSEVEKEFEKIRLRWRDQDYWPTSFKQVNADIQFLLEAHSRQQEKIELLKEGIKKFLFRYEPDRLKAEDELQKLLDET